LRTINPYGATKLMIEDMLRDLAASDAFVAHCAAAVF
jgi:UDP-glucose 4-epimerase